MGVIYGQVGRGAAKLLSCFQGYLSQGRCTWAVEQVPRAAAIAGAKPWDSLETLGHVTGQLAFHPLTAQTDYYRTGRPLG